MTEKELTVKLLYAAEPGQYLVQIGSKSLFIIKEVIALALKEKEGLDIVQVKNLNEIK